MEERRDMKEDDNIINAFAIWKDSMGGSKWHDSNVYIHKRTAELSSPPKEEFTTYMIKELQVSRIHKSTGNHEGRVVTIITNSPNPLIREKALAKLTAEEIEVLGISNQPESQNQPQNYES